MIISKRVKVPRDNAGSAQLLDRLQEYFRINAGGKVLRFAIVDVSGKDLVVDASIRVEQGTAKAKAKSR